MTKPNTLFVGGEELEALMIEVIDASHAANLDKLAAALANTKRTTYESTAYVNDSGRTPAYGETDITLETSLNPIQDDWANQVLETDYRVLQVGFLSAELKGRLELTLMVPRYSDDLTVQKQLLVRHFIASDGEAAQECRFVHVHVNWGVVAHEQLTERTSAIFYGPLQLISAADIAALEQHALDDGVPEPEQLAAALVAGAAPVVNDELVHL